MTRYDEIYRRTPAVFGLDPDPILESSVDLIDGDRPVLDIGCGQGRNSIFLARRGLEVTAVDPSREALNALRETADREGLVIQGIRGGFEDLERQPEGFGAVMVFGLIPDLRRSDVDSLRAAVEDLLVPGGLLFITAFGTWDPAYETHRGEWEQADDDSFCSLDGAVRTYLEPGELVALFPGWSVVHSWEGLGPEHRHGSGPVERHGRAEAVLRKPENTLSS